MDEAKNKYWVVWICLALTLSSLAVFWRAGNYDFIDYDDDRYVTENKHVNGGLTVDSVVWAFSSGHGGISYWHPLTWLSHMADCQLFGLNAGRHHQINLLIHILNTLLLFLVLKSMTGSIWLNGFVAGAFALHPLHVESVVWIAERKDVLSGFFWILTMGAYFRYVKHRGLSWYLLTLLAFLFALMSKPMVVTLPFVLLLLDYWPLERFGKVRAGRLIYEKIPFIGLSIILSIFTVFLQRGVGAVTPIGALSLQSRIANAIVSYVQYILKMIWPRGLAILYPHPGDSLALWQSVVSLAVLVGISAAVFYAGRKRRYLGFGWLWFLGTLVPVIGLIQVGAQAMADRYSYIPLTGLFIIFAWGSGELFEKWRFGKIISGVTATTVLLALSVSSWIQVGYWRNSITLYEHAVEVTSNNSIMHYNLGASFQSAGRVDEAINQYLQVLRIEPNDTRTRNNLGIALSEKGQLDEAISHYRRALQVRVDFIEAQYNLAKALLDSGRTSEATIYYRRILQKRPNSLEAHYYLAKLLRLQNRSAEAEDHYRQALKLATEQKNEKLANDIREKLKLFKQQKSEF